MDISVTAFRAQCLELIRQVESDARPMPPALSSAPAHKPWAALRGFGVLHAEPEESVLEAKAFDALR